MGLMVGKSRVLWEFCSQVGDITTSFASQSIGSMQAVPVPWRRWAPIAEIYITAAGSLSDSDFEAGVFCTAALCCFNVFMNVLGLFLCCDSSEGEGFCDWMFTQVVLFLQLVLGYQKTAHFIIFTDYITSESRNILRTLKTKSKSLHINRK